MNYKDNVPLLITRALVFFPGPVATIDVGRNFSLSAMNMAMETNESDIVIVAQKDLKINDPKPDDIYLVGTLCHIEQVGIIDKNYRIRVVGKKRVKLLSISNSTYKDQDTFTCTYEDYPLKDDGDKEETNTLLTNILSILEDYKVPNVIPKPVIYRLRNNFDPVEASNFIAYHMQLDVDKKQKLLEASSVYERLNLIYQEFTRGQIEVEINSKINKEINDKSQRQQREYILREKLRAIQNELNNNSDEEDPLDRYLRLLEENPYPENIKTKIKSEINKLRTLQPASTEYSMAQTYVDTVMSIPWYQQTEDIHDISYAEKVLNEDHYGLEKVKERILEYLAVKNTTNSLKAPIICLYGPPGTGKTSLAKSIARALGRKFVKASFGGTYDEAEIRGHRRTYVASMPGKIIKGMQRAGVINPVFLLDEIDKVGQNNYHGDPSSALLEVLDPEQNQFFSDNYVEEPYDLSKVLFIATANYLENISEPLRDRLELIELNTYTNDEKFHIATEHLIKIECEQNGMKLENFEITKDAIYYIIDYYTREAGVRDLQRKIGTLVRKSLVELLKANDPNRKVIIDIAKVKEYLGTEIFDVSKKEKENQIGVVTGLAYTQVGGDILPIEVNYFQGKGGLVLTGNLGDVMKESASIALDYVKANAERYGIDQKLFLENDIHIHVPEGAVPKDGPSAGIAMTVAIVSACSHRRVLSNVAMTGEVTLRGKALAIGGLKEKTLAAYRSGITKVLIPRENERNMQDLAKVVLDNLQFVLIDNVDDALKECLVDA